MDSKDKIEFICRKIKALDLDKREHVCKILLAYEVTPKQTNNGVWCKTEELNSEVIDVIYDDIILNLK